jgi:hypothetical protein
MKELRMNRVAYGDSDSLPQPQFHVRDLFVQLRSAHDHLVAEMENLDRITLGSEPELNTLTTCRWRLSQASLRRRKLASRVFDFLADRVAGADLIALRRMQAADQEMMSRSARHVGNWTVQTIFQDWRAYCEASRDIRKQMMDHVLAERQLLHPLLEGLARQQTEPRQP